MARPNRHHAVDAIVLAATTESLLQGMTREIQVRERKGLQDDIFHVSPPWPTLRHAVMQVVYGENGSGGVFVSRAERRRARGKAHDATVKQVREIDGKQIVYERKPIEKLSEKDLELIPVPRVLWQSYRTEQIAGSDGRGAARLDRGRQAKVAGSNCRDLPKEMSFAKSAWPLKTTSQLICAAARWIGATWRAWIYSERKIERADEEFYVVPIYPHQIATMDKPPSLAVKGGGGDENAMARALDGDAEFLFVSSWHVVHRGSQI